MKREYIIECDNDKVECKIKQELVRCAECRWRPEYGMDSRGNISHAPEYLKFPRDENMEEVCPCSIDDWYYSWMPADDFFCKKGERKKEGEFNEQID